LRLEAAFWRLNPQSLAPLNSKIIVCIDELKLRVQFAVFSRGETLPMAGSSSA
jgi:hypothetical protein